MSTAEKLTYTPAQYLQIEREAERKSEYVGGDVFLMAGASRRHNLIAGNTVRSTGNRLERQPCEVYPGDMRVKVDATGLYTYPDVTIVCGDPEFEDAEVDTLLNPTALFEILSKSTEAWDRGGKFAHCRRLASLREYVLVSQSEPKVERFVRQLDDQWLLAEFNGLDAVVALKSIECEIPLAELYLKVEFDANEPRST